MSKNNPHPLEWFIERIGKRVYRTKSSCPCPSCASVGVRGLIIFNEMHADYLFTIQNETELTYFDEPPPQQQETP